jgi:hypothetical protein
MMKRYLKIALLAMTSIAMGDEVAPEAPDEQPYCCPTPNFYEYHNRISVFGPLHQTYERIKTDAFYVGVEIWATYAFSSNGGHADQFIGEAELRMGYNYFYNGRDHVTPFLGVGAFKDYRKDRVGYFAYENGSLVRHHRHYEKPAVVYGVFGLLYDHEFNSIFNLGVNFKGLIGGPVNKKHLNWGAPMGGIDVSLPITFRFGYQRHWDIRLEPFDIYMHGTRIARNYVGGRGTVGYRF